ncbi:AI-2E family transporter [Euhalothece natronophila Z-M001]|uniref:AI-2E family transporter n=1 Tax=Euhalothece natronophila Z-M001 TaxID=522448 RepID=A0A5B8NMT7_9CHRO|nr:AI-2E family transporter [Euhalothece natronophila]QDZ39590.1 AI-2E family transporter [Euhalothece natronophila Z-M001]
MSNLDRDSWWEYLSTSRLVYYLLLFAFGWAITQILAYFQTVIIIFVFATILAFLLHYPVRWLEQYTTHTFATVVIFLGSLFLFTILIFTLGATVIAELQVFLEQAPEVAASLIEGLEQIEAWLEELTIPVDFGVLEEELQRQLGNAVGISTTLVTNILTSFVELIIILVIAFFMLLDGEKLWQFIVQLFPERWQAEITSSLRDNFLGFFRGRLILSIFFGVSAFFVYWALQTPYPWLLAAIAGVFDLIPGIGATLGVGLTGLMVLPQGLLISLQVVVYCVVLQQIEENVLMPRIMQDSVNLNPVVIFFSLLVGARIAGFLGIFLAIPTAAVIVGLFRLDAMKS